MLEQVLRDVHEAHIDLIVSEKAGFYDGLFAGPYSPLATFSGVIQLGYAYGLIAADDYRDLNLIRKIRNEAAHCDCEFSFGDPRARGQTGGSSGVRLELEFTGQCVILRPCRTTPDLTILPRRQP
jgi:hypothetical protein